MITSFYGIRISYDRGASKLRQFNTLRKFFQENPAQFQLDPHLNSDEEIDMDYLEDVILSTLVKGNLGTISYDGVAFAIGHTLECEDVELTDDLYLNTKNFASFVAASLPDAKVFHGFFNMDL